MIEVVNHLAVENGKIVIYNVTTFKQAVKEKQTDTDDVFQAISDSSSLLETDGLFLIDLLKKNRNVFFRKAGQGL